MPPGLLGSDLYLAYVHSQMNLQTCSWCQSNSLPYVSLVDPLTPPPKCPLVSRGVICLEYIHSHVNFHKCAKSFQPFVNRSSRLVDFPEFVLRSVRLFAGVRADSRKNTPKKQHLYIENYYSGPNMQTSDYPASLWIIAA